MVFGPDKATFVRAIFRQLMRQKPERALAPGVLAEKLRSEIKTRGSQFSLTAADAGLFGSAAVEMWVRAVHSFLISNSLLKASPIWSSAVGYYSSHYVMRAFSHLLGHFLLGRDGHVVKIELREGNYVCEATRKNPAEHQYYWELPKRELGASDDVLFSNNPRIKDDRTQISDGFHRVFANYFDHVDGFPNFVPLDEEYLKTRIDRLSDLVGDAPTIPDHKKYPDLDAVHIIAYARIVKFREYLDDVVGPDNKYWHFYRDPPWFSKYLDFQIPSRSTAIESYRNNVLG